MKIRPVQLIQPCFFVVLILFFAACSISHRISKQADRFLLEDSVIAHAQAGICIYEPASGKFLYNHNAGKYFIPASNTKLFTLYAGMKYLGDSLVGLRYSERHDSIFAISTGDPTLLHPSFTNQPVIDFLITGNKQIYFVEPSFRSEKYGPGWAWDDYNDAYMVERNALPVYGNVFYTSFNKPITQQHVEITQADYFKIIYPQIPGIHIQYKKEAHLNKVSIKRNEYENSFSVLFPCQEFSFQKKIPFVTNGIQTSLNILHAAYPQILEVTVKQNQPVIKLNEIKTQPSDSLFKPMMKNSDNFFAEQTLLMASNEVLGYMSEEDLIDSLLKKDFADIAQQPRWVDGSGLSRYNLFTPESCIYILQKLQSEFGLQRIKSILPTAGEGTLEQFNQLDSSFIYAKTGSLSNNYAVSGYMITQKGKLLIFSVLINNFQSPPTTVRNAVVHFLHNLRITQ